MPSTEKVADLPPKNAQASAQKPGPRPYWARFSYPRKLSEGDMKNTIPALLALSTLAG